MKRKLVAILAASLVSAMVLSGCGSSSVNGDVTVMTVDGTEISMGEFQSALRYEQASQYDSYQSMVQMYAGQGMAMNGSALWESDLPDDTDTDDDTSPVWDTGICQKTYGDNLVNQIATVLASYETVAKHADEYDVSLSEEEQAAIADTAKTFCKESDAETLSLNGITEETVTKYLTAWTLYQKVQDAYLAQAEVTVTDEEAESMTVSYVRFTTSDDYPKEEDVKAEAEKFLKSCQDMDDVSSVDFSTLLDDYPNAAANSESMAVNDEEDQYVFSTEDMDGLKALENGQLYGSVLSDGQGAYYVMRMNNRHDADATESYRQQLTEDKKADAFQKQVETWMTDTVTYEKDLLESVDVSDNVVYTGVSEDDNSSDDGVVTETQVDDGTSSDNAESGESTSEDEPSSETDTSQTEGASD